MAKPIVIIGNVAQVITVVAQIMMNVNNAPTTVKIAQRTV
jgi:hypothetical protein